MKAFLPDSLFGRTMIVLLGGLIISHVASFFIYYGHREEARRAAGGYVIAQRIANLARLVNEAPSDWRQKIIAASNDPSFTVSISSVPIVTEGSNSSVALSVRDYLAAQQTAATQSLPQPRITILTTDNEAGDLHADGGARSHHHGASQIGLWRSVDALEISMPLEDDEWLSFVAQFPRETNSTSRQLLLAMAIMSLVILGLSAWLVRSVVRPLDELATAANRFEKNLNALPMPVNGTHETRQAGQAFNRMQSKLRELIENRTRLLAAISHDLRTPLTTLRLRAENHSDDEDREKMLATIAEMNTMISATMQFAKDEAQSGPRRRIDLSALLASVVADLSDNGLPVEMTPSAPVIYECHPDIIKRVLTNLIENGVKYGRSVRASIATAASSVDILIDDDGPGIDPAELERVFQPFYRIEGSRARETGGIGLGLAIARSAVEAHNGSLTLHNRQDGGLRARISMPT